MLPENRDAKDNSPIRQFLGEMMEESNDTEDMRMNKLKRKYHADRRKISLQHGRDAYIKRARERLQLDNGSGMDLLLHLVRADTTKRFSSVQALTHPYFDSLKVQ